MSHCKQCQSPFEITPEDREVLTRFRVPDPTFCHDCRRQRRLSFRNEFKLYKRDCDLCHKPMVTLYSPEKKLIVYCPECWWSDKWNPLDYGKDFDFTRPFFGQVKELMAKVPLLSNVVSNSVNCEFNSFCVDSKDCYRNVRVGVSESVFYSYLAIHAERCMDCFRIMHCQDCYECVECEGCHHCQYSQFCKNCQDCVLCYDCVGCKNCFGSMGLRNAEYHFFNKKYSKVEYEESVRKFYAGKRNMGEVRARFMKEEIQKRPVRAAHITNSENSVGDYIIDSKDLFQCFTSDKSENSRFSWGLDRARTTYESDFMFLTESCYEDISAYKSQNIFFSFVTFNGCGDLRYCMHSQNNCTDCFGCLSLKRQSNCILNKKYSKAEYEALLPRVIEHMKKGAEYGEFFPTSLSTFAYNESIAQDYFPIAKEAAESGGWAWREEDGKSFQRQTYQVPADIESIKPDILDAVLACRQCKKNYKIIDRELDFYKLHKISIPDQCWECRHAARSSLLNPNRLWARKCAKCGAAIQTTYSPDRPEIVYCESCYFKEVY